MSAPQLYRFLDEDESIREGDEYIDDRDNWMSVPLYRVDTAPCAGAAHVFRRPVNGYVVDLDVVEPMHVDRDGRVWVHALGEYDPNEAEAFALSILAAVAKVRAS